MPRGRAGPQASAAATACQCNVGLSGPDGDTCVACPADTFKNTLGSVSCSACPASAQSPNRSPAATSCQCHAGYTRTILLHIIRVRPSKQPLMVRTFLKVYMEPVCVFYYCRTYYKAVRVGGGGEWRTCAMRDDEPRPVWMSLPITH